MIDSYNDMHTACGVVMSALYNSTAADRRRRKRENRECFTGARYSSSDDAHSAAREEEGKGRTGLLLVPPSRLLFPCLIIIYHHCRYITMIFTRHLHDVFCVLQEIRTTMIEARRWCRCPREAVCQFPPRAPPNHTKACLAESPKNDDTFRGNWGGTGDTQGGRAANERFRFITGTQVPLK
jgi:hypothetical protein